MRRGCSVYQKTSQRSAAHGGIKCRFVLPGGVYARQNTLRPASVEFVCRRHTNYARNRRAANAARLLCCNRIYKPGSVLTAIYLGAALPRRSSHLLGSSRAGLASSTVLLRIEFTASRCSHVTGELLPRLSTLTTSAQAPYPSLRREAAELVHFAAPPLPHKTRFVGAPFSGRFACSISLAPPRSGRARPFRCASFSPQNLFCGSPVYAGGPWRYLSVALFLGSPPAGVTRYPCPMEPGLSSRRAFRHTTRGCPTRLRAYFSRFREDCQIDCKKHTQCV